MTNLVRNFHKSMDLAFRKLEVEVRGWVEARMDDSETVTPMDTAELRESAYVELDNQGRWRFTFEAGYDTDYAPVVHEWPPNINWTTPGTGPKFLEDPFYTQARGLRRYLAKRVKL